MVGGEPWVVAALLRCLVGSLGGSSYSWRREEREEGGEGKGRSGRRKEREEGGGRKGRRKEGGEGGGRREERKEEGGRKERGERGELRIEGRRVKHI